MSDAHSSIRPWEMAARRRPVPTRTGARSAENKEIKSYSKKEQFMKADQRASDGGKQVNVVVIDVKMMDRGPSVH